MSPALAALLDGLHGARLAPLRASALVGAGERRSRAKGPGIEFVDHRPYRDGDDLRYVDHHALARTGEHVMREFARMRQLSVVVALDASASMLAEGKFALAEALAQALGFLALEGGDSLRAVVIAEGRAVWSPAWRGVQRAEPFFAWLAAAPRGGAGDPVATLAAALPLIGAESLIVVISDWWEEGAATGLAALDAAGHEVLAIQVLAEIEADPEALDDGAATFADAETGEEIAVRIDGETRRRYAAMLARWRSDLSAGFAARRWRLLSASAGVDDPETCLMRLRGMGAVS